MGMLRLLHVLVLTARILLVEAQNGGTTFDYPPFNTTSNLLLGWDAQIKEEVVSGITEVYLNSGSQAGLTTTGTCASLLYGKPLQMRGSNSSFTTAFTFYIMGTNSAGFAFVLLPQNHTTGIPGGKLCLMPRSLDASSSQFFAVEFDTFKNPEFNDPSNNHVGVNVNSMNSSATYNLCGDGIEECLFLVSDYLTPSAVQVFTAWVDYDSVTKTVAVFLTNGSTLQDIPKPASPIVQASVDLNDVMSEEMFVGFSASTTDSTTMEPKSIMSWSFRTSATQIQGSPTLGPGSSPRAPSSSPAGTIGPAAAPSTGGSPTLGPGSSSPAGSIGPAAAAPLTGGSGSYDSKVKLAGGITVVGVAGLLAIAILYKLFRLFRRPLRFFLSHAGGEHEEGKNFPDWLYDKMTESWKLKRFIKVFLDRRCLPKGKRFPHEINQELEKTEVGVVVVTPEFFTRKWPMTELISFMKSQDKNPDVRILPLFYKMPVSDVRTNLRQKLWEEDWEELSRHGNHSLPVEECRAAVQRLCDVNGIEYHANTLGHDRDYIELVVTEVAKIVREGIWRR